MLSFLLVLTAGCAGPHALRHSRAKYSSAVQVTQNEQLLLNLVRLRYRDTPSFLELSILATQFSFDEAVGISGTIKESSKNFNVLGLSAGATASERPTASYTPLHGADFVTKLITPIEEETIVLLTRSGWKGERVFRIAVQSLNGVPNMRGAAGPTPPRLRQSEIEGALRFTKLVRDLEDYSEGTILRFNYEDIEIPKSAAMPRSTLTPRHAVEAAQHGFTIIHSHNRVSIDINKIATESQNAASDFINRDLLKSYAARIKRDGLPHPIRVKHITHAEVKPQLPMRRLPPPRPEQPASELPAPKSEPPSFTVVDDDLLFLAVKKIRERDSGAFSLVSCDVIEPGNVIVAGSSQKLGAKSRIETKLGKCFF